MVTRSISALKMMVDLTGAATVRLRARWRLGPLLLKGERAARMASRAIGCWLLWMMVWRSLILEAKALWNLAKLLIRPARRFLLATIGMVTLMFFSSNSGKCSATIP